MPKLSVVDPVVAKYIESEIDRQRNGLEMIASENLVSEAVLEALGTPLTNKYSEGYPGKRYYGGNEFIDAIESLAIERAKQIFGAEHVNVQPHAGSQANMAAYFALAQPGDTILAMDLSMGGHLTHGASVNFSGKLYKMVHYGVRKEDHRVDMDMVRELAKANHPKVIVAGYTAYTRHLDFKLFREIAEEVGAYLMVDMAHFSGLVAGKCYPDPIPYADVVTTTTHKTLRGPRGAMILCKLRDRINPAGGERGLAQRIDSAVFPGMQGGPLEHVIAAKAVCFQEALQPEFAVYQNQTIANAKRLAATLVENGVDVVTGGTDNHMVLIDISKSGVGGKMAETLLDLAGIYTNKNMIPFDTRKPMDPSGLRVGTPALTSRGFKEDEMRIVGLLISQILRTPESEVIREDVRRVVKKLTAEHPVYAGLSVLS
jgi:glycine hydroxymethyltransferase